MDTQALEKPKGGCIFSTSIADQLTCTKEKKRPFDFNGFPRVECPEYPCEKYNKFIRDIAEHQKKISSPVPSDQNPAVKIQN